MDILESKLDEKTSNNGSGESSASAPVPENSVKEKQKTDATSSKIDSTASVVDEMDEEKDDLLERLDKIEASISSAAKPDSMDVDIEEDDLLQRMEAIEKGEEEPITSTATNKPPGEVEVNHQNGECSREAESKISDVSVQENKETENIEGISSTNNNTAAASSTLESEISNCDDHNLEMEDEEENVLLQESGSDFVETTSASAKRRMSDDIEMMEAEPTSKKIHIEELDGVSSSNDNDKKADNAAPESSEEVSASVDVLEKTSDNEEVCDTTDTPAQNVPESQDIDTTEAGERAEVVSVEDDKMEAQVVEEIAKVKEDAPVIEVTEELESSITSPIVEEPAEETEDIAEEVVDEVSEAEIVEKDSENDVELVEETNDSTLVEEPIEETKEIVGEAEDVDEVSDAKIVEKETCDSVSEVVESIPVPEEKRDEDVVEIEDETPVSASVSEEKKDEDVVATEEEVDETILHPKGKKEEVVLEIEAKAVESTSNPEEKIDNTEDKVTKSTPMPEEKKTEIDVVIEDKVVESTSACEEKNDDVIVQVFKSTPEVQQVKIIDVRDSIEEEQKDESAAPSADKEIAEEKEDTIDVLSSEEEKDSEEPKLAQIEEKKEGAKEETIEISSEEDKDTESDASNTDKVHKEKENGESGYLSSEKTTVAPEDSGPENGQKNEEKVDEIPLEKAEVKLDVPDSKEAEVIDLDSDSGNEEKMQENDETDAVSSSEANQVAVEEKNNVVDEEEPMEVDDEVNEVNEPEAPIMEEQDVVEGIVPVPESTKEKEAPLADTMEVDSAIMPSTEEDGDVTKSINNTCDNSVAELSKDDESNTVSDSKNDKRLDDSIECSIPSSSSDNRLKNKLSEKLDMIKNASSTPNSVTSSNVYNSTPINKQFEISSENVSKITTSVDNSHNEHNETINVASVSTSLSATPVKEETEVVLKSELSKISESSEVDSCTASSVTEQTSDEISRYAERMKKYNGISSTTAVDAEAEVTVKIVPATPAVENGQPELDLSVSLSSEDFVYEVGVWLDGNDLSYLSIEKLEPKVAVKTENNSEVDLTGSSKHSSNGSVSSFGPFSLPGPRSDAASSTSASTNSSQEKKTEFVAPPVPKVKQTIKGATALCNFMIREFTKIKRLLSNEQEPESDLDTSFEEKTPRGRPNKGGKGASKAAKRSFSKVLTSPEEEVNATKQAKRGKVVAPEVTSPAPMSTVEEFAQIEKIDQCCLARWTDRKYYGGRVIEAKPDNKFVVLFEDGAKKTLNKDIIVFGEDDMLPILGHSIHALASEDTYEPGIVTDIKRNEEDNVVIYSVLTAAGNIPITASDMYLNDEQAKMIHNATKLLSKNEEDKAMMQSPATTNKPEVTKSGRPSRRGRAAEKISAPSTPEAGFSGGIGKKGRRGRSKPQALLTTFSESSDISDTLEEDSAPNSPDSGLEAIDGVQPELQKTQKESEMYKMNVVAKYLGNDKKNRNLEDMLGPIPTNKTIFRGKHFILTCTIPVKDSANVVRNDYSNKNNKFTTLPFVKDHLRSQIEAGGGKVYQHFEEVPKSKYKQCKLIAPHPSATAKYVQCLAVDIPAISHEWIIECCRKMSLVDTKTYTLPSGWSIIDEKFIKWASGRGADQRHSSTPFHGIDIMIASLNKDFTSFWSRVCKLGGATPRLIKSETDLTQNLTGYMLTDQEFPEDIKFKAAQLGLTIVSTVWAVQSLIVGKPCNPEAHEKLTQIYQDDDY